MMMDIESTGAETGETYLCTYNTAGKLHSFDDNPARVNDNHTRKEWFFNGCVHREHAPAVITNYPTVGYREFFYFHGVCAINKQEFNNIKWRNEALLGLIN